MEIAHPRIICHWVFWGLMFTENHNDLNGLKTRLETADARNGDLLRALNDTLGKLSLIPNGKHTGPALCIR